MVVTKLNIKSKDTTHIPHTAIRVTLPLQRKFHIVIRI